MGKCWGDGTWLVGGLPFRKILAQHSAGQGIAVQRIGHTRRCPSCQPEAVHAILERQTQRVPRVLVAEAKVTIFPQSIA